MRVPNCLYLLAWGWTHIACEALLVGPQFLHHRTFKATAKGPKGFVLKNQKSTPAEKPKQIQAESTKNRNVPAKKKTKTNKGQAKKKNKYHKQRHNRNSNGRAKGFALNRQIVSCETAFDILDLLASVEGALTRTAGGGALNSINFSTAIHRIAKYIAYNRNERGKILSDPRFAMFFSSLTESFARIPPSVPLSQLKATSQTTSSSSPSTYSKRESANIAWALVKLGIVPPKAVLPIAETDVLYNDLIQTSIKLRTQIVKQRRLEKQTLVWVPTLSHLSAKLSDSISTHLFQFHDTGDGKSREMANLLWAFTSLDRYTEPFFDHISGILIPSLNVGQVNPQEVSNTLWAYATAKYTGKYRLELMRISAQLLESNEELLNSFNPQEFSNTAWALATILGERRITENLQVNNTQQDLEDSYCVRILRPVAHALSSRCDEFKSQEISNSVWALGCLGFGAGKELSSRPLLNDHIILKSDDHDGDEKLVQSALATVSKSATTRLGVFKEQELNNLAYGFARLHIPAPELCQTIADEFTSPRRRLSGQDIATTLWSFASLQFFDKDSFCKVASRVRYNQVERWNPQELSNIIWAIGTAQIVPTYYKAFDHSFVPPNERLPIEQVLQDPLSLCFAASARELMKRPQEFKVQEIKDMLWGFSKSGVRHPRLFRSVAEHLVGSAVDMPEHPNIHCGRGLDEFSSRIMASLLWTFAKQAQLAAEYNYAHFSGRMAVYCASSIDIGDTLIKRLVNAALVAGLENFDDLSLHTTTDLSNTIWAMATLGYYHGPFVNAVERQVIDRLDSCYDPNNEYDQNSFRSQELANIVWSLACTNSLSAELITSVGERIKNIVSNEAGEYDVKSISSHFQRRELANLVWSCAVAGCYPPELIRILVIGLVGEGEDTAESVEEFYGDGGLAEHSIMTLLYLRSAIDTDGFSMGISLPPNFPSGWGGLGKSGIFDENEVVLNLRPSKIQNSVSAAFDRIGFGHVDEYVLKMQGLNLLSIDIASPVEKIGVEVDGPSHFYVDLGEWSPHEPQRGYAEVMNRKLEYRFEFNGKVDKPNGSSALKDRLLRNLGWTILHVPYGEWYDLGGDSDAEEAYCRALLEQRIEK